MDKKKIIDEIVRTTLENNGKPLGMAKFSKVTGIGKYEWFGVYWAKWGDALIEAGFKPNKLNSPFSEDFIKEKLASFIKENDKFPVAAELRIKKKIDKDFPNLHVFDRLGNKVEKARKIIEFCEGKKGFNKVINICERVITENPNKEKVSKIDKEIDEYVYLLKSGRFYKIGRTKDLGRREYDIKLQLPEETKRIHYIRTDDSVGIEAYWHNRFKDKRKKGEWFDLTSEDIKAFKKRKFM